MKGTSAIHYDEYNNDMMIPFLNAVKGSTKRSRPLQLKRRPRILLELVLVLVTISMLLVLVTSLFSSSLVNSSLTSVDGIGIGIQTASSGSSRQYYYHPLKHEQLSRLEATEDRQPFREISVLEYEDIDESYYEDEDIEESYYEDEDIEESYYEDDDYEDDDYDDDTVETYSREWSLEQIEEMEKYYKRYLEVFLAKHGDEYEPDDMEVVYTEYLAYRERRAMAKAQAKAETKNAQQQEADQAKPIGKDVQEDQTSTRPVELSTSTSQSNKTPATAPAHVDVCFKHNNPFCLEMDWEDVNEVGGDLYSLSNNYTETMKTAATSPTITIVAGVGASATNSMTMM